MLLYLCSLFLAVHATPSRPVIGVFPTSTSGGNLKAYKEWLAQEGADYVQLPSNFKGDQLEKLFQSINGFLIPGYPMKNETYEEPVNRAVKAMVQRAVKANTEEGDYFPIWGTCKGFEWLVSYFGDSTLVTRGFDSLDVALPLHFTDAAAGSQVYAGANSSLMSWFENEAIAYNLHELGVTPQAFAGSSRLTAAFNALATSLDRKGKSFVSQIEGKSLPIYGTQFHPEHIEFVPGSSIPHTPHAVAGARYLGQFFVSEARKNKHNSSRMAFV